MFLLVTSFLYSCCCISPPKTDSKKPLNICLSKGMVSESLFHRSGSMHCTSGFGHVFMVGRGKASWDYVLQLAPQGLPRDWCIALLWTVANTFNLLARDVVVAFAQSLLDGTVWAKRAGTNPVSWPAMACLVSSSPFKPNDCKCEDYGE